MALFRVLLRADNVTSVKVTIRNWQTREEHKMKIQTLRKKAFNGSTWVLAEQQVILPLEEEFTYEYEVTESSSKWFSRGRTYIDQTYRSILAPKEVFDIFRERYSERNYEVMAQASVVYAEMLLQNVTNENLRETVMLIEEARFPGLDRSKEFVTATTTWIQEMIIPPGTSQCHLNHPQRKFLAVLIGKLIQGNSFFGKLISDQIVHLLTQSMQNAILGEFPTNSKKDLESVCTWLVLASNGNWMDVWLKFHNLFDLPTLKALKKMCPSPDWTLESVKDDLKELENTVVKLKSSSAVLEELLVCCVNEMHHSSVLKEVMVMITTHPNINASQKVTDNALRNLEDMIKKRWPFKVRKLDEVWQDMRTTELTEMTNLVRRYLVNCLARINWDHRDQAIIKKMLLCQDLYSSAADLKMIIKTMLTQQHGYPEKYELFMQIIQEPEILVLATPSDIQDMLETALQSLDSSSRVTRTIGIVFKNIYKILLVTRQCENIKGHDKVQRHIDTAGYKIVRETSLDLLFDSLACSKTSDLQAGELEILAEHIIRRLGEKGQNNANSINHVNKLKGTDGRLCVSSAPICTVVESMIELQEEPLPITYISEGKGSPRFEASIMKIIRSAEFWIMVFGATGSFSAQIRDHPKMRAVAESLKHFLTMMSNGNLTITFVRKTLKKHSKSIIELLTTILPTNVTENGQVQQSINGILASDKLLQQQLQNMDQFFKCVEHLANTIKIQDVKKLVRLLRKLQKSESEGSHTVKECVDEAWWDCLFQLVPYAEKVQGLSNSLVFLNICRSIVEGTCSDVVDANSGMELVTDTGSESSPKEISDSEDSVEGVTESGTTKTPGTKVLEDVLKKQPIETLSLAQLIEEVCIPTFQQHCKVLLESKLDISVRFAQNMIDGIRKAEKLTSEMEKLTSCFQRSVSKEMFEALKHLVELPDLSQRSCQLGSMFQTFEISDEDVESDEVHFAIKKLNDFNFKSAMTLQEMHEALQTVSVIERDFKKEDWDVIEQLADSQELVAFLRPLVDEDFRNLIDAVEERSEQHVNESTVSDLIDVKRYMEALLKVQGPNQTHDLIEAIKNNRGLAHKVKGLPAKIDSCASNVHSLRVLFYNVANRGEMTKEIIHNALEKGEYEFMLDDQSDGCNVVLTYQQGKEKAMYGLTDLNDFRSRALLIVNTTKHAVKTQVEDDPASHSALPAPDYDRFIECVNTINEIIDLCTWLRQSGHFNFQHFEEKVHDLTELQGLETRLKRMFSHWQSVLEESRAQYYFLNFFHSKQLWQLDQFFQSSSAFSDELLLLFRFVNPQIEVDNSVRSLYEMPADKNDLKARLFQLGIVLGDIFSQKPPASKEIPGQIKQGRSTLDSKVRKGCLFVADLDEKSTQSIPVLLQLYRNTTSMLPEPNQVIFCHPGTTWEEISLLLQRCVGAPTYFQTEKLFTLVNVDQLSTEAQFSLVREIQQIQESKDNFLLAMICCGGKLHHIIDQFANCTHRIQGFSDAEMSSCLRLGWPEVEVVTSEQPGLGKTEYIRDKASQLDLGVSTLHVSGPINKNDLVQQMRNKRLTDYDLLHIDVSSISDPGLFDAFLFEIVVIGMSVSGTHMCMGPTTHVILEVANTYQDKLRNSLAISSCFTRKHLEWTGFDNFIVSQDINSPVQVVCHYLSAMSNGFLDKGNIELTGNNHIKPLKPTECVAVLKKYCSSSSGLSYAMVNTFLAIFAQELRRMSASLYFTTQSLKDMLGDDSKGVRSNFVQALLEVSKDFTARSVKEHSVDGVSGTAALLEYRSGTEVSASQMVARIQGMVRWADSNHLLVVFHRQDSQTISILYRLLNKVPTNIKKLFALQMKRQLEDYNSMSQTDLHKILEKVCRSSRAPFDMKKLEELATNYALTPDNLLKMVLIHMRIKSRVPVIIMGETGCGKTTLITYLARVCEVPFHTLNLHAGVSEQNIIDFVTSLREQAENNLKQEVWGFLDEINTCDHLGVLNEVICHHSLKGVQLPDNLIFIAACNPYRLRENSIVSTGLDGKHQQDEMSKLVYRVHPLPETMMDYVWDYGSLDKEDEKSYIRQMLGRKSPVFVDLVVMSQEFMRKVAKTSYCVSLRDVHRCQHLKKWFVEMLGAKGVATVAEASYGDYMDKHDIRSVILALAHCYHSRLTQAEDRQRYREEVASILSQLKGSPNISGEDIEKIIKSEQLDFLNRMQLQDGTAKNEALRENVFVILVSILNRIPVFVVGKPGCSKSLSMQLIRSNLRGQDSKETYFKTLPSLYVVSFQGSESSTSEGIIKVFDKAKNYKKPDVMPVVLLDEIGLAEVSRFNPLKVLHSQLEPTVGSFPSVAVVGISNWSLDAAKMNRAIHLSRPEPTIKDLADTAKSIRDDSAEKSGGSLAHHVITDDNLFNLAKAYSEYQLKQKYANFHGLRDYYSLVKYVAIQSSEQLYAEPGEIIENGILRNFGGLKVEMPNIMNTFTTEIGVVQKPDRRPGTVQLIQDNIGDKHARHLMLITSGDSALNILETTLEGKEHVTKFGSRFENDISEEYNYRVLSEIILCMETGVILVLRDLENIYGSLYDMLNQNYLIVGKKRNCRVALGPHSNPFSNVHPDFRCIVLVDEQNVDFQNPPFLNRFEKQTLRFSDILTDDQVETIGSLRRWIDDICFVEGYRFSEEDMFLGWHSDTLPSLVYHRSKDHDLPSDITPAELALRCRDDLMKVACPDAVLRASKSEMHKRNRIDVEQFQEAYFNLPLQNGLGQFFKYRLESIQETLNENELLEDEEGSIPVFLLCSRTVIYTHSSVHTDIASSLDDVATVQVEKLSKFKSERHFASQMHHFWFEAEAQLLVLQCMTSHDAAHMLLAKSRIDEYRSEYLKSATTSSIIKHAFIIVHIDRIEKEEKDVYPWQFNFLCGWEQYTLDSLEPSNPPLEDLLHGAVADHLVNTVGLSKVIEDQLLWCFSCIKYESKSRGVNSALALAGEIAHSDEFIGCLKDQVLNYIRESERKNIVSSSNRWQVEVATNIGLLCQCSTLSGAMMEYIEKCVREPLARSIILLEQYGAWSGSPCQTGKADETADFWQACFHNPAVFDINMKDIPEPRGPESCLVDANFLELKFPFFKTFHDRIEGNKEWLMHQRSNDDSVILDMSVLSISDQLSDMISRMTEMHQEYYLEKNVEDYIADLYNVFSVVYASTMPSQTRSRVMKWLMNHIASYDATDLTVSQQIACVYATIWSNVDLLAAELQLITIYSEVTLGDPETLIEEIQKQLDGTSPANATAPLDKKYIMPTGSDAAIEAGDETTSDVETSTTVKDTDTTKSKDQDITDTDTIASKDGDSEPDPYREAKAAGGDSSVATLGIQEESLGENIHPEEIWDSNISARGDGPEQSDILNTDDNTSVKSDSDVHTDKEQLQEDDQQVLGNTDTEGPSMTSKLSSVNEASVDMPIILCDQPAETLLVSKVCRDILPDKQVLAASDGLHGWQRKASSVLLLAGRVSPDSAILHFLRLCRDFVMLSEDFNIGEDQLSELSVLGKDADDPLSSEDVFRFITSYVDALRGKEVQSRHSLLGHFLTSYFGLCLEANIDTPLLPQIIERVCTTTGELLPGSRPVLLDIIRNDVQSEVAMNSTEPVCEKLICTGELDEIEYPNVALLDEMLTEQEPDSSLSTICCDVIEEVAFQHITCDFIAEITSDDDSIWKILSNAVRIVEDNRQVNSSLQFTAAAALVRAFIKAVADLIHVTDIKHFKLDGKYFVIAKTLNGLFTLEEGGRCENGLSLPLVHLLKCLRDKKYLGALRNLCRALADPITNLKQIKWQETMFMSRLPYSPMGYVDHYSDAVSAISTLQTQQNRNVVKEFVQTAQSSPGHRLALLAAVTNTFYFIQTTRGLRDVDKQAAQWLFDATTGFTDVYRCFLQRLLGLADFTGILHLSESTSYEDLEIASVVVHLVAIVVSHADNKSMGSAFLAFLDQSTPVSDMILPGTGDPSSVLKTPQYGEPKFYDCICGLRVVSQAVQEKCSVCHKSRKPSTNIDAMQDEESKHEDNIWDTLPKSQSKLKFSESVHGLSPVAYRVLDTILNSCFLAGLCSGLTKAEQIAAFLRLGEDSEAETSSCETEDVNAASGITVQKEPDENSLATPIPNVQKYLNSRLEDNWHLLRIITQTNYEGVTLFLHRVIRSLKDEIAARSCLRSAEDSTAMEHAFSQIINFEAKAIPTCLLQQKRDCLKSEGVDIDCLEAKLEELDPVCESGTSETEGASDNGGASIQIQQVFRRKHQASLVNFQSQFASMCRTSENKYPFLQLCLSRLEILQYVRYLPDLLKWNSVLIGRLNHAIKRDDARRTKVDDFLSNDNLHPTEEAKKAASHAFTSFQEAWNQVRDGWSKLTSNKPTFGNVTRTSSIAECVVDKKDPECHLRQVIGVLLEVQNSFLMDTMAIASSGNCPVLIFVMKGEGVAGLKTTPLHAADASIIQFEWSDDLLVYHDLGTGYGYGCVVEYKYPTIERELARMLVLNKALLVEGSGFTQFEYSDELFHACSVVLKEIKTSIFQTSLPVDLINSIKREQSDRLSFAKDLLEYLDVILVLLKKTGGDPGSSLDEYIKRWSTQLPGSFPDNLLPEPRDGIKLQHIVSLYETLEDLLVDANVESLRDEYREDLPERGKEALTQNVKPLGLEKLEATATMIRRFIFRFLRSDTNTNTNTNLKDLVVRSAADTMDCSLFTDVLPDDIEVKHIVKILEFILKQAEVSGLKIPIAKDKIVFLSMTFSLKNLLHAVLDL